MVFASRGVGIGGVISPELIRATEGIQYIMLTALVLVCSLAVTPDLAACDQGNALDVMRTAEEFASPASCLMHGQALLAQTEIGRQLRDDERVKISCSRIGKVDSRARSISLR